MSKVKDELVIEPHLCGASARIDEAKIASSGGMRYNKQKIRVSWVPREVVEGMAKVLMANAEEYGGKYPRHNWKKGLPWTETAESLLRHLHDFLEGKDVDEEDGQYLIDKILCNAGFLAYYRTHCPEMDDREKEGK